MFQGPGSFFSYFLFFIFFIFIPSHIRLRRGGGWYGINGAGQGQASLSTYVHRVGMYLLSDVGCTGSETKTNFAGRITWR